MSQPHLPLHSSSRTLPCASAWSQSLALTIKAAVYLLAEVLDGIAPRKEGGGSALFYIVASFTGYLGRWDKVLCILHPMGN